MTSKINNIVILGGGTAGWLSACILAKKMNCLNSSELNISVVESPDIPTIGVGEGTVPTMRQTLKLIGVSETDFIRECGVTFKQSIKFVNWLDVPNSNIPHSYHHFFNFPKNPGFDLTPYWLLGDKEHSYADYVSFQSGACNHNLAPKKITHKEFDGALEYAYHLDAAKFSTFLAKHGTANLGIKHIIATVKDVCLTDNGDIKSLITNENNEIDGDFFVDCSGFSSRLLAQELQVGFIDKGHQLLVNRAVAMQVPYADPEQEILPYTTATAQDAGWIWDIGLTHRRGVGYVYSSEHITDEEAESKLRQYVGNGSDELNVRIIPMKVGYRDKIWHKNCVAMGLAAGFVEPLEATALLLVEASAKLLADKIPCFKNEMSYAQKSFNQISQYGWDRVIDFIKLHYLLSNRTDTQFWRDNQDPKTVPESLSDKLNHWKNNLPTTSDFFSQYEVFRLENYQYVLYGMEFNTDINSVEQRYTEKKAAINVVKNIQDQIKIVPQHLDSHRTLIDKIKEFGLNKI